MSDSTDIEINFDDITLVQESWKHVSKDGGLTIYGVRMMTMYLFFIFIAYKGMILYLRISLN